MIHGRTTPPNVVNVCYVDHLISLNSEEALP